VTISTSLPYIYLNPQLYNYLMTNYFQPVCTLNQDDLWSCPCGNLSMYPELIFTSLDVSINLSPVFYLNQTGDAVGTCLLMLTVNSDTSSSFVPNILGTMVMEKMVVTFYPQQNIMSFSKYYDIVSQQLQQGVRDRQKHCNFHQCGRNCGTYLGRIPVSHEHRYPSCPVYDTQYLVDTRVSIQPDLDVMDAIFLLEQYHSLFDL